MDVVESSKGTGSSEMEPQMSQNEKNSAEQVMVQRRVRPRLMSIPRSKKPYYGSPSKRSIGLPKKTDSGSHPINATGTSDVETSDHIMVKKTIKIFNKHRLHFVQEAKCSSKRPDLKAMNKMSKNKKRLGHLPGVSVGQQFFSRAEMVVVGLHGRWMSGIDYMGKSYKKQGEYNNYTFPLAVAVVLSGNYEDNEDDMEEVVYSGEGGNDILGTKQQIRDQVMERGNLALKNSMEQLVPVRVIRGHKFRDTYPRKVYTYDGLYMINEYWEEKGISGFIVFKYKLDRFGGQPKASSKVLFSNKKSSSRAPSAKDELVCKDIAKGQEKLRIPVINEVDNHRGALEGFTYSNSLKVADNVILPPNAAGCNCKGKCTNPMSCSCAERNGSSFPYVLENGNRLLFEPKDVVFECGPNCGCGPNCLNRTSQQGIKYHLEVFRTKEKGWGVRTLDFIPSGSPVCEYIGELKRTKDINDVFDNDYIFEIDCWQTMHGIGGREKRLKDVQIPVHNNVDNIDDMPEYCIDARKTGSVSRFVNHSCEPNLFVQCVLSSHHDLELAQVVLFAAENITPSQELTYDYGYILDGVVGPDGNIKELACRCGAASCSKRLY
ncbi:histone-lysine N-methyltransferase, H3 lysine-9 specific SUVH4 isoform X2 [Vitis vinifera]|uniref:histone-lysine N-methyltransferase, H3 lysine-9 specific SUVH4 isoform X2 n=2 Tax=Vitis vinifera TaxID=29760 RepID=UPI0008FEB419|nr:histone-lysine N-methyltransferase, H3 lysine-9 specific SUVH4 isoform X2 [Vitis vinifera]|eukprot:XP_019078091.1 PREDICTED: histone-lysine N-methyltransferase, H3 lysine-9 specific SUVH4 isoform X2 [Vitis vinifera]